MTQVLELVVSMLDLALGTLVLELVVSMLELAVWACVCVCVGRSIVGVVKNTEDDPPVSGSIGLASLMKILSVFFPRLMP